jgi:hypothetical protein
MPERGKSSKAKREHLRQTALLRRSSAKSFRQETIHGTGIRDWRGVLARFHDPRHTHAGVSGRSDALVMLSCSPEDEDVFYDDQLLRPSSLFPNFGTRGVSMASY